MHSGTRGATVTIDGEEIFIPPGLYKVREETVEVPGEEVTPHVIEPSYGIDRMIYAVLEHSYDEETVDDEERKVASPFTVCCTDTGGSLPAYEQGRPSGMARDIAEKIRITGLVADYDDSGAIGRRYRRQDEIGTPFAITVDYDTKGRPHRNAARTRQHAAGEGPGGWYRRADALAC